MIFNVRHVTSFRYQPAIRESTMEVRMQPRNEGNQTCLRFDLEVEPAANLMVYRDHLGNTVHHFDIPGSHDQVRVTAQALIDLTPLPPPPPEACGDWDEMDALLTDDQNWEFTLPSQFARPAPALLDFFHELGLQRQGNPLELVLALNHSVFSGFSYAPNATHVDSPIEDALSTRAGVCQDFAHIMIALLRQLRIPARYVSGYLCHDRFHHDRSPDGATHAWVEALLPRIGWLALDPTNDDAGGGRHIRVAVGRDYADVPPTRGVYRGEAASELAVVVQVAPSDAPPPAERTPVVVFRSGLQPLAKPPQPGLQQEQQQQ